MKVILVCADAKSRFLQMLNPKTWVYQKAKLYPETIEFIHAILDNEELWELTFDRPLCVKHNLLYSKGSRLHDYYMQYWLFQNRLYVFRIKFSDHVFLKNVVAYQLKVGSFNQFKLA